MATFISIVDVFGDPHVLGLWNIRFYYNPVTKLIEPIPYDQSNIKPKRCSFKNEHPIFGESLKTNQETVQKCDFYSMLFNDVVFYTEYIKALNFISSNDFITNFIHTHHNQIILKSNLLKREGGYSKYSFNKDLGILKNNADYIQQYLKPIQGVHTYLHNKKGDQIRLEIGNYHHFPIELVGVFNIEKELIDSCHEPILLQAHIDKEQINYELAAFHYKLDPSDLLIGYRILGLEKIIYSKVILNPRIGYNSNLVYDANQPLIIDTLNKILSVKKGIWNVNKSVVLPKNYKFICDSNLRINLRNGSRIVFQGKVKLSTSGSIQIESTDSSKCEIVINNTARTFFKNVLFNNVFISSTNSFENTFKDCLFMGSNTHYIESEMSKFTFVNCTFFKKELKFKNSILLLKSCVFKKCDYPITVFK